MFRNRAQILGWRLENGQRIEARVLVTLYEARGDFQLNIETARKAGIGNLFERFVQLKEKLDAEGLFAPELKRQRPSFPRKIGIVTSPQAAALQDILTTLRRRAPHIPLIIYPTAVQGETAPPQIAAAIQSANERAECDVLIVSRGGGSIEDLWAFNDEQLARTIRASLIPIITGIGHETDFTIADFAADQRAPTPTAAAELAAPERAALINQLQSGRLALMRQIERRIDSYGQQLDGLAHRLLSPTQQIEQQRSQLHHLASRLRRCQAQNLEYSRTRLGGLAHRFSLARPETEPHTRTLKVLASKMLGEWQKSLGARTAELAQISASLAHLNPDAVLARGYSIVTDADGNILRSSHSLEPNDQITVSFHTGRAEASVTLVSK